MARRPTSRRRAAVAFALVVCVTLLPSLARAQSRFALELDIGAQAPLSSSVHNVVSLDTEAESGDAAIGTPRLSNRQNSLGLHLGFTALVSTLEIRYRIEGFSWRGARTVCVGDRQARQLPNG